MKNENAVKLGKLGGTKRWANFTPEQRKKEMNKVRKQKKAKSMVKNKAKNKDLKASDLFD